ncbi:hypothetical protein BOTBODRAFT_177338 [Botryobasidium botryosum FD-172 SS1]|uniref:Uncharacterized protein n=1 Tax=Botryobasidium botryosum (strain FD-172 SS1) TaxID=930990 RepID=A0A067M6A5_BOTB1|nr:hypothetical protein BOTBODRAFT_177338 [Botryobasidium botryosum FD-172 SS1]
MELKYQLALLLFCISSQLEPAKRRLQKYPAWTNKAQPLLNQLYRAGLTVNSTAGYDKYRLFEWEPLKAGSQNHIQYLLSTGDKTLEDNFNASYMSSIAHVPSSFLHNVIYFAPKFGNLAGRISCFNPLAHNGLHECFGEVAFAPPPVQPAVLHPAIAPAVAAPQSFGPPDDATTTPPAAQPTAHIPPSRTLISKDVSPTTTVTRAACQQSPMVDLGVPAETGAAGPIVEQQEQEASEEANTVAPPHLARANLVTNAKQRRSHTWAAVKAWGQRITLLAPVIPDCEEWEGFMRDSSSNTLILAKCLMQQLKNLIRKGPIQPVSTLDFPSTLHWKESITLRGLLHPSLEGEGVGKGVLADVLETAMRTMLANKAYFQNCADSYTTLCIQPGEDRERIDNMRAFGALAFLYIYVLRRPPGSLSPLLFALLDGSPQALYNKAFLSSVLSRESMAVLECVFQLSPGDAVDMSVGYLLETTLDQQCNQYTEPRTPTAQAAIFGAIISGVHLRSLYLYLTAEARAFFEGFNFRVKLTMRTLETFDEFPDGFVGFLMAIWTIKSYISGVGTPTSPQGENPLPLEHAAVERDPTYRARLFCVSITGSEHLPMNPDAAIKVICNLTPDPLVPTANAIAVATCDTRITFPWVEDLYLWFCGGGIVLEATGERRNEFDMWVHGTVLVHSWQSFVAGDIEFNQA